MSNRLSRTLAPAALLALLPVVAFGQDAPAPAPSAPAATEDASPDSAPEAGDDVAVSQADGEQDDAAAQVGALPPLVADVQVLGPWVDGERRGIWRTVMLQPASETDGNRFFVQQLEEVDGAPAVSSSTEITEIADLDGAVVSYRPDEPSEAQPELLTLFLDIVPLDGEIAETYELFYTADEPYTFGPASN